MKNLLKKITGVVLSALLLCVGLPVAAQAETAEDDTVKILAIGNSYSNNTTFYISKIAESMGKNVSATSLYYPGCSIEGHVEFYNNDSREYQFYVDGVNITGWEVKNTMKEVFDRDDYDYITVQQGPGRATDFSTYWTEEKPYLTELYDIIKKHEPQAEVMIHQTWSFSELDSTMGTKWWSPVYDNSLEMFKLIENAYEQAADKLGIDKEKGIIPVGRAIQLAKDEYGYWDAYNPGYAEKYLPDASDANAAKHCENGALYTDDIDHLNHRGRYIAGCVWLEQILGYDCREATFYPEGILTATECEILRAIAHEAVTGEKAYIDGDWRVLPDGYGVEIVHYMGAVDKVGTLTIPATIGGKKVTRVDDTAFKYVEGLKNLIIPNDDTIVYEDGAIDKYFILKDFWDGTSVKPTNGLGTKESPFLIENGSHLYWAVTNKNEGVYFKLTNDITLNDIEVDIENGIAHTSKNVKEWYTGSNDLSATFAGIIDGDYHIIKGLYIDEDFNNTENMWDIGAGLIARGANGATIKNLGVENSFVRAVGGSASVFIGTTGNSNNVDICIENSYIGEDVYIYGGNAGGFIGGGNGAGYVSGISNCYSLATIKAESFAGAILGGVSGGTDCRITNCYATMKLHGRDDKNFVDCYAPEKNNTYDKVTIVSVSNMKGQAAITKLSGLSDAYTLPDNDYPVLKAWSQKSDNVWSGFAATALTGNGTQKSPYLITNGEELAFAILSGGKGKYYKLNNDIYLNDINAINWETAEVIRNYVPSSWLEGVPFTGYFDGDGHIVHGIYYPAGNGRELPSASYAALIPQITKNTHITNVGVKNSYIEIFGHAAGIVGSILRDSRNENILIDSCFTDDTVYVVHTRLYESTSVSSSGVLGATLFTPNVKVSNCYSLAHLLGPYSRNKIVGATWMVPETFVVENCYADGNLWHCTSEGNSTKTAINSYSTEIPNATYKTWTQLTAERMQGLNVFDNMPLGDKFIATEGYPMLKIFARTPDIDNLAGDVDGNGVINTDDLATLKLFLGGVIGNICEGGDMNGDGNVNTIDLAELKLYLVNN